MATYKIQSGDTLPELAKKYGTTVEEIKKLNGISDSVYAGMTVKLPELTGNSLSSLEGSRPVYLESGALTAAKNDYESLLSKKPAAYADPYSDEIKSLTESLLSRPGFSYSPSADPVYQQYSDRYRALGERAMLDTMGNAAALTGGFGSTYAETAGNQAYGEYLTKLSDLVPELYQTAYSRYQDEGDALTDRIGVLSGLSDAEYEKYRDTVSDYESDLDFYYTRYGDMSKAEYEAYQDDLAAWQKDRAYYYGKEQDAVEQNNFLMNYSLSAKTAAAKAKEAEEAEEEDDTTQKLRGVASNMRRLADDNERIAYVKSLAKHGTITEAELTYLCAALDLPLISNSEISQKHENEKNTSRFSRTLHD